MAKRITFKEITDCPGIMHAHAETDNYLACVYPRESKTETAKAWLADRGIIVDNAQVDDMGRIVFNLKRS